MSIYTWSSWVIRDLERSLKNFFSSGSLEIVKKVVVKWDSVVKRNAEGGMGIRRLKDVNDAMQLKLAWDFFNAKGQLALWLRQKFLSKQGTLITYYKRSSIWRGVRHGLKLLQLKFQGKVGMGDNIDF